MSFNLTPSSERFHIGIFGRCNAGKSSLINAITNQELAIVSDVRGTTTDPVYKAMELPPLGPVVLMDTPGWDDDGGLGKQRIRKAQQSLNKADLAVLVIDATVGLTEDDKAIMARIQKKEIPLIVVCNKIDLVPAAKRQCPSEIKYCLPVSCHQKDNIDALKRLLASRAAAVVSKPPLIADLLRPDDLILLVTPIDEAAPKGRLILPQQQTVRDILEARAAALIVQDTGLKAMLARLPEPPKMIVTDSQVFDKVARVTPASIPLTSFSMLFARYKGDLEVNVRGASAISRLRSGDRVLISEGCTHHRQCNDIGTVKLPGWLKQFTGQELVLQHTSGTDFPDDLRPFQLIVHCGACMLNDREVSYRLKCAQDQGVPFTNYGVAIAYMHGILPRVLQPFPELRDLLP